MTSFLDISIRLLASGVAGVVIAMLLVKYMDKLQISKLKEDKAARAVQGLLLYPYPHLRKSADPMAGRDTTVEQVALLETQLGSGEPLRILREEIRLLALAYTKAQSDMNAQSITQSNNENFSQSMGDAWKFHTFMNEHFKNDFLNNPGLKILEVTQIVLERMIEQGKQ